MVFLISLINCKQSNLFPQIMRKATVKQIGKVNKEGLERGRKKYFFFPSAPVFLAARGACMTELRTEKKIAHSLSP